MFWGSASPQYLAVSSVLLERFHFLCDALATWIPFFATLIRNFITESNNVGMIANRYHAGNALPARPASSDYEYPSLDEKPESLDEKELLKQKLDGEFVG